MLLVPDNAPILVNNAHNHGSGNTIEVGEFLQNLRDRAVVEGISARAIFEETARR